MAHGDITHIDIPVTDTRRSATFYQDLFGWQINEVPGFEGYPMWRAPNQISGGGLAPRGEAFEQPRSYVEVDSIDAVVAKVEASGCKVLMPRSEIDSTSWFAIIEDPDGNHIGLYEGTTDVDDD